MGRDLIRARQMAQHGGGPPRPIWVTLLHTNQDTQIHTETLSPTDVEIFFLYFAIYLSFNNDDFPISGAEVDRLNKKVHFVHFHRWSEIHITSQKKEYFSVNIIPHAFRKNLPRLVQYG